MTSPAEKEVLKHLATAWNLFVTLDAQHPSDRDEFTRAIHAAQNIVACRVAQRVDCETWPMHAARC